MAKKPWMYSSDLIESVKRKIALPISQSTFTENDILAFADEEMFISQVPSVLQYHQDYFTTYTTTPLLSNVSRYPIPDRCIGMKLRDLFLMDQNGNLYETTRVDEHDRVYFQGNVGINGVNYEFYLEGNEVVLASGVFDSPTYEIVFVFYLRPNQLVKDDRAATISSFRRTITVNNSLISPLDTVTLGLTSRANTPAGYVPFTAVSSLGGTITAIANYNSANVQITCASHQLSTNQTVVITGTDSVPAMDGTYTVTVLDEDTFYISGQIATPGTTGSFISPNQFQIGGSGTITAASLAAAIDSLDIITDATSSSNTVSLDFSNIYMTIDSSDELAFVVNNDELSINFESLPSTYTDLETNETEDLFVENALIDFLQTKPGHKTYIYDVEIPTDGISGSTITFDESDLLIPTGTVNAGVTDSSIQMMLPNLQVGDYICLANECIIPQIPPDLHNGLAERTASRILAAQGDQAGLQVSMGKIQEIEVRQGNLMSDRSEGTPQKVVNRNSLLTTGRLGRFRRF